MYIDPGDGIGALALGVIAGRFESLESGFWFTSGAMILSGLWVAIAMEETLPRLNPRTVNDSGA